MIRPTAEMSELAVRPEAVHHSLESILKSREFRASARSKQFLRFVVVQTLEGHQAEIKERTIAIEVFHRDPDFEPADDAVVRVSANEVRRRLAQYYADSGASDPVRISLPHGSYVPEFEWMPASVESPKPGAALPRHFQITARLRIILAGAVLLFSLAAWLAWPRPNALDLFWAPLLHHSAQPILCLPASETLQSNKLAAALAQPVPDIRLSPSDVLVFHNWHVSMPVIQGMVSVSTLLAKHDRAPALRIGGDIRVDELRGRPIIAIGSFSNVWVKQRIEGLRFTFDRGPTDKEIPRIRDRRNPNRSWSLPTTYPGPQDRDYAIVTRTFEEGTGEMFVSLAGLHSFGCQAAGEAVADPKILAELARRAPSGWEDMNLQIVLESRVVGVTPSAPKILDAHFWTR